MPSTASLPIETLIAISISETVDTCVTVAGSRRMARALPESFGSSVNVQIRAQVSSRTFMTR
jgi:hypothetical protein